MIALTALLAISLVSWRYWQATRDNEIIVAKRATERADTLAGLFADTIGATLRQATALHNLAGLLTEAQLAGEAEDSVQLRAMLNPGRGIAGPDVAQVASIGADGRMLWTNLNWSSPPVDLSDREHFRVFQRDPLRTMFFSSPVTGRANGERTVQYARPLQDREGRLKAVTVLSLRADMLARLSAKIALAEADAVVLLRDDGEPLMYQMATTRPLDRSLYHIREHLIDGFGLILRVGISRAAQARTLSGMTVALWHETLVVATAILAIAIAAAGAFLALERARVNAARAVASMHNEAWFRTLINEMADGVLVIDDLNLWDNGISFANRRAGEVFGLAPDELVGRAVPTLAAAGERARLISMRDRLLRGEAAPEETYLAARPDGDTLWIAASAVTTAGIDPTSRVRAIITVRDVTQQQASARELAETRARIDRMLKVIPGAFYIVEYKADGTYDSAFVSDGVQDLFGVESTTAMKEEGFLSNRTEINLKVARAAALGNAGPDGVAQLEYRARADGRDIWLRDTTRLIHHDNGQVERVGFLFDCTTEHDLSLARQAADAEVKRLNQALNAYSRSLAVLLRAGPLQELMERVCEGIVADPHYALAFIALPEKAADKAVRIVAAAGPARAYAEEIRISWDEEQASGRGPTGQALRSGEVVVWNDAAADPAFAPWRAKAARFGIRSSVSLPCKAEGTVIGALVVYSVETDQFQRSSVEVFERLAKEVSLAIAIEQSRKRLRVAEQSLRDFARLGPGLLYRARLFPDRIEVLNVVGEADRVIGDVAGPGGGPGTLADIIGAAVPLAAIRSLVGVDSRSEDFAFVGIDGTARWIRNSIRIVDRQEGATELVGYILEVTLEKQRQLQQQQFTTLLTLGEMATGLAHELNQPLATINFTAQNAELMLTATPPDVPGAIEKIHKINGQINRAAELIGHMRIFARNDREPARPVSWADTLDRALDILRPKLLGCEIRRTIQPDLPDVIAVPIPMEQILINLISNAVDAYASAPPDRPRLIEVIAAVRADQVLLRVKDHAGGVPPAVLPRIWEPFYTTKALGKGTGLGLSLVFGAVVEMGGSINAINEDDGAVFEVTLPAAV